LKEDNLRSVYTESSNECHFTVYIQLIYLALYLHVFIQKYPRDDWYLIA